MQKTRIGIPAKQEKIFSRPHSRSVKWSSPTAADHLRITINPVDRILCGH